MKIKGFFAVYLREILIMKHRGIKLLLSMVVAPILYIIAFGYGIGRHLQVNGVPYLYFLIPGLVAMNSMTQAFNIAGEINIARFYWKIFEEFQASPLSDFLYVLGEVLTGITRALINIILILTIGYMAGVKLNCKAGFWIPLILNSFVFSSIAVFAAMRVKSHADQALLNNFIIFPMAFLGGTFFPLKNLPEWAQIILKYLPISVASKEVRGFALYGTYHINNWIFLFVLGCIFYFMAYKSVKEARD